MNKPLITEIYKVIYIKVVFLIQKTEFYFHKLEMSPKGNRSGNQLLLEKILKYYSEISIFTFDILY